MGCCNHNLQLDPSEKPSESPTADSTSLPEQISVWGWNNMTASHKKRYWNTLYMYKDDLLGVWRARGVTIIIYSLIQVRNRVNHLDSANSTSLPEQISVWGCIHMNASHNRRYWNTLYMNKDNLLWVWQARGAAIIFDSLIQVRNPVNHLLLILHLSQSRYQCGIVSIWLPATIECIETLCICMKTTWYEYEAGGVPQS
jgi:hypothetical protein